jgi:isopenicillin N synthase-like dioxygenase
MLLYTPAKTPDTIPVIDIGSSRAGRRGALEATAADVHKAARETGFFYIVNHGVDRALIDAAFAQTQRFFQLPDEAKRAVAHQPGEARGYLRLEGQMLDTGSPGDLKEGYTLSRDASPEMQARNAGLPEGAPNRWPDLPGFREPMLAYYDAMLDTAQHVMQLLAVSLDLPPTYFADAFRYASPTMRIHRYPPQPANALFNQLGAGAHTDWGVVTILAQDANGGLEVQNADGDWLRATPIPGTFVVNLGDMMARWSNDLYHSTMHRVLNNASTRDRYSIAFFNNAHYATRVECLPTCLADGATPLYEPCTAGEYLHHRRLTAAGLA